MKLILLLITILLRLISFAQDNGIEDPKSYFFHVTEIEAENTFDELVAPYLLDSNYVKFFDQGYDIIDFDNDGKLDYATQIFWTDYSIDKTGLGVFSFNLENNKITIELNPVVEILGEDNANAPEVGYLNNDDTLDIFIPTGNFHGEKVELPSFYNVKDSAKNFWNRPDFIFYKTQDGFKMDSLDLTDDWEKYGNTSLQKPIQIDSDKEEEIVILPYLSGNGASMAFYDFNDTTNRHEYAFEVFTDGDKVTDVFNLYFDEDELLDLITLSVEFGSPNKYYVNKYTGIGVNQNQIDFNSKELIATFFDDENWGIAENEEHVGIDKINGKNILFIQYHDPKGDWMQQKLEAYDLSTQNASKITEYLFGKEFTEKHYITNGFDFIDIDNDGDNDFVIEHSSEGVRAITDANSNLLYIQDAGRFHPVKYNIKISDTSVYLVMDLNQDNYFDLIDITKSKFYITDLISTDSDSDGIPDELDQCPDTPNGLPVDSTGCISYTYVPDDNFQQALRDLGIDTLNIPDTILTPSFVTTLDISSKNISDLTGIQDFESLTTLNCGGNLLTNLDISQNKALTNLDCGNNPLTSLDISNNADLTHLSIYVCNTISSIDLSNNTNLVMLSCGFNSLTELDVSNNPNLQQLYCDMNNFKSLDLSHNTKLRDLVCHNNHSLSSLNLKNGKNDNLTLMEAYNCPNLTCINVDDPEKAATYPDWTKDATATYSDNCVKTNIGLTELEKSIKIYPNPVTDELIIENLSGSRNNDFEIINAFGQSVLHGKFNEKTIIKTDILTPGIYVVRLKSGEMVKFEKILKH